MPWYVDRGGEMSTPSVIGMKFEDAQRLLDSLGLNGMQGDIRADHKYPVGSVINQNPPPGKLVNHGRRIYLTISGGEKLVVVPNLRGRTVRDGTFRLEREGLKLGSIEYATSDEFPPNTIISQQIPPDMKVRHDTYVSVVVSEGKTSNRVAVPNLNGKTLADAEQALKAIGLVLGNVAFEPLPSFLPNTIIDQFPHSGETVSQGQAVDVVVVKEAEAKATGSEN